jgi:ABC-type nitrate/sulfonate/bicarbonate transport system permease component
LRTDLLFVSIVILAALGVILFSVFGRLERLVTRGEDAEKAK